MNRRAAMASPLIALTQPTQAQGQAQAPLRIFAAGPGSAFLPYAEGLAAYLRQGGIPAEARTSAGSLQNLALVEDDPLALGTAFLGSVQDALQGSQGVVFCWLSWWPSTMHALE
jgi:TRAP-type uncharacterized transport system substrate-binding protein